MKSITSGDRITLKNEILRLEILTPWSEEYRRTRFDHLGFIAEVWVHGECYSRKEELAPPKRSSGGSGLCCEYKCECMELDSGIGEDYLKMGVGIVERLAEPWSILDERKADIMDARLDADPCTAHFICDTPRVNGYAYHEDKIIRIDKNQIIEQTCIRNTGEKTFSFGEYCHNFLGLGDRRLGADHHLSVPCIKKPEEVSCRELVYSGQDITWTAAPWASVSHVTDETQVADPYAWKLTADQTMASIREEVDFLPDRVVLWSRDRTSCVEIYVRRTLLSGEETRWSRRWTFT